MSGLKPLYNATYIQYILVYKYIVLSFMIFDYCTLKSLMRWNGLAVSDPIIYAAVLRHMYTADIQFVHTH